MGNLRLNEINIIKFHSDEYLPFKVDIAGKNLFIFGTNTSGKSTTFDALIASIFGHDLIDRKKFEHDSTTVSLENEEIKVKIQRKHNKLPKLEIYNKIIQKTNEFKGNKDINDELSKIFNLPINNSFMKLIIRSMNIPQRDEDSILRKLSSKQFRDLIHLYTIGPDFSEKIAEKNHKLETLSKEIKFLETTKDTILSQIKDLNIVKSKNKNHFKNMKNFIEVYESNDIMKIKKLFNDNNDLEEHISTQNKKRTGLYNKEIKLKRRIGELERFFDKKLIQAVEETLNVLICPVCQDYFDSESLQYRKNNNKCPFCGNSDYGGELYTILKNKIDESKTDLTKLNERLDLIIKEKNETDKQIEIEKNNKTDLKNLNPIISRIIKNNRSDEDLKNEYELKKKEFSDFTLKLQRNDNTLKQLDEENNNIEKRLKEINEEKEKLNQELAELTTNNSEKAIEEFSGLLNEIYQEITRPDKYKLEYLEGKLYLITSISRKDCSIRDELSYSEKKLIDVALWITLLKLNIKYKRNFMNFAMIDDIFDNFDNEEVKWKDNVLNQISEVSKSYQLLIFSKDQKINNILKFENKKPMIHQKNIMEYIK